MLGRCEEPGLSGDGLCQVPLDGRPYLAREQWALTMDISADVSLILIGGRFKAYKLMFSC